MWLLVPLCLLGQMLQLMFSPDSDGSEGLGSAGLALAGLAGSLAAPLWPGLPRRGAATRWVERTWQHWLFWRGWALTQWVWRRLWGARTMAVVVDWLTRSQLRRHLGALRQHFGSIATPEEPSPDSAAETEDREGPDS